MIGDIHRNIKFGTNIEINISDNCYMMESK